MDSRYRLNAPDVTFEIFDGEVVVINLINGYYYSLRASAVPIWALIAEGHCVAEVSKELAHRCLIEEHLAAEQVAELVGQFEASSLIVKDPARPAPNRSPAASRIETTQTPFAPPVFESFTDMKELLLLDPVHQVDVTGWPAKPPTE